MPGGGGVSHCSCSSQRSMYAPGTVSRTILTCSNNSGAKISATTRCTNWPRPICSFLRVPTISKYSSPPQCSQDAQSTVCTAQCSNQVNLLGFLICVATLGSHLTAPYGKLHACSQNCLPTRHGTPMFLPDCGWAQRRIERNGKLQHSLHHRPTIQLALWYLNWKSTSRPSPNFAWRPLNHGQNVWQTARQLGYRKHKVQSSKQTKTSKTINIWKMSD